MKRSTRYIREFSLKELLKNVEYSVLSGTDDRIVRAVCNDTRNMTAGAVFVCIQGEHSDSHNMAQAAVYYGAAAIVTERELKVIGDVTVILVKDTHKALSQISSEYFGRPSEKMLMVGVTGTKGKTTTAYMIESILAQSGFRTGIIGSIEVRYGGRTLENINTTPEAYKLQEILSDMEDSGVNAVVMEVSSQGLMHGRVAGIYFDYGVFTNLSRDHIGNSEHSSMEDYVRCKSLLFGQCRHGIFNKDDLYTVQMLEHASCETISYYSMHYGSAAEDKLNRYVYGRNVKLEMIEDSPGVRFEVCIDSCNNEPRSCEFELSLPGLYSAYNTLAAVTVCDIILDMDEADTRLELMAQVLSGFAVKGRSEVIKSDSGYSVIVDYAHNEMSLRLLLEAVRDYTNGRLICLFGCGGNRSVERRYQMGKVSAELADITVVTSDNPRYEKPEDIMEDIEQGILDAGSFKRLENEKSTFEKGSYILIQDRYKAIRLALNKAESGDVVVIAGKGHETYQDIMGIRHPMDDSVIVREYLSGGNNGKNITR